MLTVFVKGLVFKNKVEPKTEQELQIREQLEQQNLMELEELDNLLERLD